MRTVSGPDLKAKLDKGEPIRLVEALAPDQFDAWHLPGAINVPADRVKELAPRALPDRAAEIVVYCSGPACHASVHAARLLETLGYQNVSHYPGGKQEWEASGYPVERPTRAAQAGPRGDAITRH